MALNPAQKNVWPARRGNRSGASESSLVMEISGELSDQLSTVSDHQPLDLVLRKAVLLYLEAKKAVNEGKHVGITNDPKALETEFEGL